jgi:di/tricarboxylate transporter
VVVLLVTSLLWLTDFWHRLDPAVPAVLGAVLLLLPVAGVVTWKEFETSAGWSTFFVLGTVFSFTRLLQATGTSQWLAGKMALALGPLAGSPMLLVLAVVGFTTLVHLVVPNIAACLSLCIPVVSQLAAALGLNPVVLGLVVAIVTDAVILYPAQTASNLMVYDSGAVAARDVLRLGLTMLCLACLVIAGIALPWWALLGESLVGR